MTNKFIHTGQCIWCGKKEPEVTFYNQPHIVPHALGGDEIGFDICDCCNSFFGTSQLGKPSLDLVFKEIFNAYRFFSQNLNENSYKNYKSVFFQYYHKKHVIRIKNNFNSNVITHQFKRSLFYIFLQKYHFVKKNGNHPMFDTVRNFVRYDWGNLRVFYVYNNIILVPTDKDCLHLPMTDNLIEDMMNYGLYSFWLQGQLFFLEIFPTAFNVKGLSYLRSQANKLLIPAEGDEGIFEVNNIYDIDFLMQRFSK